MYHTKRTICNASNVKFTGLGNPCKIIQKVVQHGFRYTLAGNELFQLDERAIPSHLGIPEKKLTFGCVGRGSNQTLGSAFTKFCTQVFGHKISVEFVREKNYLNILRRRCV